jgi:hypothetical protein
MAFRIDDLSAELIRAVLALYVSDQSDDEALIIHDFIQRIDGKEDAELALEMLERVEGPRGVFQKKHGGPD